MTTKTFCKLTGDNGVEDKTVFPTCNWKAALSPINILSIQEKGKEEERLPIELDI